MALARTMRRCAQKAPDVFVSFGIEQQFRFISHPGVMAVSKLLEMRTISRMRANFTQENIEESLPRLLEEKKQLAEVRSKVSALPVGGPYQLPSGLDISAARPVPGQKDMQGTMMELAELQKPGCQAAILEGPAKDVKQLK